MASKPEFVRTFAEEDIPIYQEWQMGHGVPEMQLKVLGPEGWVAVDEDGRPAAMAWLNYQIGNEKHPSILCAFSWPITNPDNTPKQSYVGLSTLLKLANDRSKLDGYGVLMTWAEKASLDSFYLKQGFKVGEENIKIYYKEVT